MLRRNMYMLFVVNIPLCMQSQHDYTLGNYPVGRDDAAQLAALQILVDIGSVPNPETITYVAY